jgi:hypothetical protein
MTSNRDQKAQRWVMDMLEHAETAAALDGYSAKDAFEIGAEAKRLAGVLRNALAQPAAGEPNSLSHLVSIIEGADAADMTIAEAILEAGYRVAPPAAAHGDEAVRKDASAAYVAMSCNSVLIDGSTCYYLPAERMAAFDRMFSLGAAMRAQAGEVTGNSRLPAQAGEGGEV